MPMIHTERVRTRPAIVTDPAILQIKLGYASPRRRLFPLRFPSTSDLTNSLAFELAYSEPAPMDYMIPLDFHPLAQSILCTKVGLTFRRISSIPRVLLQWSDGPASHPVYYVTCLSEPQPIPGYFILQKTPHDPAKIRSRPCPGLPGLSGFAGRCGDVVAASGVMNINLATGMVL